MKGIILDFDNLEKKGLILAEDGNRYHFNYEKDWKNKNKNVEIDIEVDFIIANDSATEIFSLNKNNNSSEQRIEKNENINSNFKKINFETIEKEINNGLKANPGIVKERKKEAIKLFLIGLGLVVFGYTISEMLFKIKWLDLGVVFVFISYIGYLLTAIGFIGFIVTIVTPKKVIEELAKNDKFLTQYKEELKIINYIPNGLQFQDCGIIHSSDNSFDGAMNKLIKEAFNLKADAILNFKQNSNTSPNIKSSYIPMTNTQQIKTNMITTYRLEGVAIKLTN